MHATESAVVECLIKPLKLVGMEVPAGVREEERKVRAISQKSCSYRRVGISHANTSVLGHRDTGH